MDMFEKKYNLNNYYVTVLGEYVTDDENFSFSVRMKLAIKQYQCT